MNFKKICFLLICCVLPLACGKRNKGSADKPYKAIVLALTSVDAEGSAHFALVERPFFALDDLDTLDGTYARILRGGSLSIKEVNGSIVQADSFTGGASPDLRYTVRDGVVVASDYSTLAMLSGFYQFDYIYSKVSEVLGIEPATLQTKLPGGKHTILFEPLIAFDLSAGDGTAGIKLNAAFSPKDKQFLLFQRSGIENVPLSGNLQVISHEFGHSLFDYAFFDGAYDEKNYLGITYALRGLNEGWADFVSWNFTGSPDILRSSINISEISNPRHSTKTTFMWDHIVSQTLSKAAYEAAGEYAKCRSSFYCIGTLLARSLIATKQTLTSVDAKTFASGLVASLRLAQSEIKSMPDTIVPVAVENDAKDAESADNWTRQGKFSGAFLRALIKNVPAAWQATMCENLAANFGIAGFPAVAREGVCP